MWKIYEYIFDQGALHLNICISICFFSVSSKARWWSVCYDILWFTALPHTRNKHSSISSQLSASSFTEYPAFYVMICDSYFPQWVWHFYVFNLDCFRKIETQMQMFGSWIDVLPAPMLPASPPPLDCSSVEVGHHCRKADLFSALTPSKHTLRKFLSRIFVYSSPFLPSKSKYRVRNFNNAVQIETPTTD